MKSKFRSKISFLLSPSKLGGNRLKSAWDKRGRKLNNLAFIWVSPLLLVSLLVTTILGELRQNGTLEFLALVAYDQMVRWRSDAYLDPRLLIVGITESDIQQQQQWPISDQIFAQLLEKLQQYEPKVIGLDIYRDIPYPPGQGELLKQLQANNVIVIEEIGSNHRIPPPPTVPKKQVGFNDLLIDPDNVLRRNLMYVESPSGALKAYSFSLRLSLSYLAQHNLKLQVEPDALRIGNTVFNRLKPDSGSYQMPQSEAKGWQTLINYRSEQVAQQVTLREVLDGKIEPNLVKDKIVLIGIVAPSGKDMFPTPYSAAQTENFEMPGVVAHSQMVSQILSAVLDGQPQFWFWNRWGEWLWIWGWSIVGGILVWRSHHPLTLGLALTFTVGGLWGIGYLAFTQAGWIPLVSPLLALLTTSGIMLGVKILYTQFHDPLTGLPNRRLLIKELQKAIYWSQKVRFSTVAALYLDLNSFHIVKHSLGYQTGELLILKAARRLQTYLQGKDKLARVGPSEFAIYLGSKSNLNQVIKIAKELHKQLSLPFKVNGQEIFSTVNLGIALNQAGQPFQAEELLRNANIAMYRAKVLGKLSPEVFVTDMYRQNLMRLYLEIDLHQALKRQEFELYYQPIVSLTTGKIVGFEALIRWQSLQRGLISPEEFIPLAEETGLIIPLGEWILQQACTQLNDWQQQFPQHPPLFMSVNLSSRQFVQPNLVKKFGRILAEVKLKPNTLKLEVTETSLIGDLESALSILLQLQDLGVSLSLDDFGTGYSSLSYLHRFPFDILKVDKSFVSTIQASDNNSVLASTIVTLGHNLGMEVVAEGIETETQLQVLKAFQCEYGQGYLFSLPLSSKEAATLLAMQPS